MQNFLLTLLISTTFVVCGYCDATSEGKKTLDTQEQRKGLSDNAPYNKKLFRSCFPPILFKNGAWFSSNIQERYHPLFVDERCRRKNTFCLPQAIIYKKKYLTFEQTPLYELAVSREKCKRANHPLAVVRCSKQSGSRASPSYDMTSWHLLYCDEKLYDVNQSMLKKESTSVLLATLEVMTSNTSCLTKANVTNAIAILLMHQEKLDKRRISEDDLTSVVHIIDNLMEATHKTTNISAEAARKKSTLLSLLRSYIDVVFLQSRVSRIKTKTRNVDLQVARLRSLTTKRNEEKNETFPSVVFHFKPEKSEAETIVTIRVHLESKLYYQNESGFVYASILRENLSFSSNSNTSQVISIGITSSSISNLTFSVNFTGIQSPKRVQDTEDAFKIRLNKAEIVEWNFKDLAWTIPLMCRRSDERHLAFQCKRVSTFAILFSHKIVPSNIVLSWVSCIGCGFSIILLVLTVTIYLKHRSLRTKPVTTTFVNTWICLIAVYLLYLVGAGMATHNTLCDAMTFMLHFSMLSCLTWMCVNAWNMYKAFTKLRVVKKSIHQVNFIPKYVLAYGVPLVISVLTYSISRLHLDKLEDQNDPFFESAYRARNACWLHAKSLLLGFFIPYGLMLAFNFIMFLVLLKKIVFRKNKVPYSLNESSLKDRMFNFISMFTTMGLTWVFGYLLLLADDVLYQSVMQWLFTLTNIFQGFTIFCLYCLIRKEVRSLWICCHNKKDPRLLSSLYSSAKYTHTTRSSTMKDQGSLKFR